MTKRLGSILAIVALLTSCDANTSAMLGFTSPPRRAAAIFDVVCDAGGGGSCTAATLDRALATILPLAAERPGSVVRLWMVGTDLHDTGAVAIAESPTLPASRQRASAASARFVTTTRDSFLAEFSATAPRRRSRSPLSLTLTRVTFFTPAVTAERLVVVLSDMREYGTPELGDWECGALPTVAAFRQRLNAASLIPLKSFKNIDVAFVVGFTPLDDGRCPITMPRAEQIRTLWISTVTAAGAREVTYADTVTLPTNWRVSNAKV